MSFQRAASALITAAVHWAAYAALSPAPSRMHARPPPAIVTLVSAPVESPPQPSTPPRSVPAPLSIRHEYRPPKTSVPSPESIATRVAPAEMPPGPVDLTGFTMTAANGTGITMALSGGAPSALVANSAAPLPSTNVDSTRSAIIVPIGSLSRRPIPPNLDSALRRNYPSDARRLGQSGEARVRARIAPSGVVESTWVISETDHGFGNACQKTVFRSRWSAPIDGGGRPVATEINYTCRFRVDP